MREVFGSGASSTRRRILVIDDEPSVALLIRDVLQRRGFEVVTHGGGEGALEVAADGGIDLVVSDFAIPGLNGLDFARRLGDLRPGLSVLIVSAYLARETEEALGDLPNVAGVVRKPFDIFELGQTVAVTLGEAEAAERFGFE